MEREEQIFKENSEILARRKKHFDRIVLFLAAGVILLIAMDLAAGRFLSARGAFLKIKARAPQVRDIRSLSSPAATEPGNILRK